MAEVAATAEAESAVDIVGITIEIDEADPVPVAFFALTKKLLLPDKPVTLNVKTLPISTYPRLLI